MDERSNNIAMDELSKIAMAHYQASTDNFQTSALNFFKAMDQDGNDKIDKKEFLEFMEEEGHIQMINTSVFDQLDHDGNGTLDFRGVMTVYYILKSGRPFCDRCREFITSTYFTCLGCLDGPDGLSYYLCLDCYAHQRFDHLHDEVSRFVDNYLLLEEMTKLKLSELRSKRSESTPVMQNRPSLYNRSNTIHYPHTSYNYSQNNHHHINPYLPAANAINPPTTNVVVNPPKPNAVINLPRSQWKAALAVLNAALGTAAIASGFCTIL